MRLFTYQPATPGRLQYQLAWTSKLAWRGLIDELGPLVAAEMVESSEATKRSRPSWQRTKPDP
jgi:hypothetical protein